MKLIARKITIVVRGEQESDVEDAFNEAVERLNNGCSSLAWFPRQSCRRKHYQKEVT